MNQSDRGGIADPSRRRLLAGLRFLDRPGAMPDTLETAEPGTLTRAHGFKHRGASRT